jgi:tRNA 2-thiouridine synthesizing protein B
MNPECDLFLLTKPPLSQESEICLKLVGRSGNARLYLAGDGVYHLLSGINALSGCRVFACQEDLEARAIMGKGEVTVPENFYAAYIDDLMEKCRHSYTY